MFTLTMHVRLPWPTPVYSQFGVDEVGADQAAGPSLPCLAVDHSHVLHMQAQPLRLHRTPLPQQQCKARWGWVTVCGVLG